MEYSAVEQYVEKYIKNLSFAKDQKAFQAVIAVLKDHFLKHSYEDIPYDFKQYVEKQLLSENLYDKLILGVGYPQELVSSLRFSQKKTIVQSLMDYNQYVSTLKYVNKVCQAFKENFNIYELYADRRLMLNPQGQVVRSWVMLPRDIFLSVDKNIGVLDYDEIYNDTPTYFLSKKQLNVLYNSDSLTLPFKTNLILLDMQNIYEENDISHLVASTAFFYYKDLYFSLYFNEDQYDITLSGAYQLWHYMLYKYQGEVTSAQLTSSDLTCYNISSSTFPYTLDPTSPSDIGVLLDEYENLDMSRDSVDEFFDTYFREPFQRANASVNYNLNDFRKRVISTVGTDLVEAVDEYIENSENILFGTINVLGSIEDSLKSIIYTSSDPLMVKYGPYILKLFAPMLIDPKMTATYQILTYFKPYHTQLVTKAKYYVKNNSKFNSALIETDSQFVTHTWPTSSAVLSDDYFMSYSVETGYFEFSNSNEVITDEAGALMFSVGDLIYTRNIYTADFPTDLAQRIISISPQTDGSYKFVLENNWTGLVGTFIRAYKLFPPSVDELVDLNGAGYYSFTNIGFANEIRTNVEGFARFNIGDFIYAPVDDKQYAVQIINKDIDDYTFILKTDYYGTPGVWDSAHRWRSAP